jgi:hypothetical protein
MGKFIWRLFILMVIFIAGLLVGNIVAPRQVLQEKDIVGIVKVKTSLDLEKEEDFATITQSQNFKEVYLAFLKESYLAAKKEYEYQLQNITKNPQDIKNFVKAQKNYSTIVSYIEQNYPPEVEPVKEEINEEQNQENVSQENEQEEEIKTLTKDSTTQEPK